MTLYLKEYQKYNRSKLKVLLLLCEFRSCNFDLSYFLSPFRYRITKYLIGKLSDTVKIISEGKVLAVFSTSIRMSYKVGIH